MVYRIVASLLVLGVLAAVLVFADAETVRSRSAHTPANVTQPNPSTSLSSDDSAMKSLRIP